MKLLLVLALGLAAVSAVPYNPRIVGGSVTNIGTYPMAVSMLTGSGNNFRQSCGGSIINNRSVLTAAHCFIINAPARWRCRVGSTNANSGGVVHNTQRILSHGSFSWQTLDSDVAVLRITNTFSFNNNVRAGSIAGPNLNTPDNAPVWVIGWGRTSPGGASSEQLRHVQVWTVNQGVCRTRYNELRRTITDNMLCAGWLDVGGRDACQGDSGGPLLHNNVIVGVTSWGESCALARHPGVYARVARFSNWIRNNA